MFRSDLKMNDRSKKDDKEFRVASLKEHHLSIFGVESVEVEKKLLPSVGESCYHFLCGHLSLNMCNCLILK